MRGVTRCGEKKRQKKKAQNSNKESYCTITWRSVVEVKVALEAERGGDVLLRLCRGTVVRVGVQIIIGKVAYTIDDSIAKVFVAGR